MAKLAFSVDSALLSELGERLVESTHLALLELVKNAYDADAKKAWINVKPYSAEKYVISVKDDGVGMTLADVKRYWMRIATTNKATNSVSNIYGRAKSGSKGIGRFSCRRLGPELSLETTARLDDGRYETTRFSINWDNYSPGTEISDVECEGETIHTNSGSTGTTLTIIGNKDGWTQRGWGVLKRRLMLLVINRGIRPAGPSKKKDPGFDISLAAPDFEEKEITNPREQLMNAGWGRLTLTIGSDGTAHWFLDAKKIGRKTLNIPEQYPELAGTTADIALLPEKKEHFRNPSLVGITSLKDALDNWGNVFVRSGGIRVYPYGEQGNDWLQIDKDRGRRLSKSSYGMVTELARSLKGVTEGRELLNMLSAKSYVGEVMVESPTGLFDLKASREGFVGEKPITLLREVIRFGIDWATVYRDFFIRLLEQEALKEARENFTTISSETAHVENRNTNIAATRFLDEQIRDVAKALPVRERKRVVDSASKAIKFILENEKVREHELQHLRLVAATSSLFLIFQHEVRSLLSSLSEFDLRLKKISKKLSGSSGVDDIEELRAHFTETKKNFHNLLQMTSLLSVDAKRDTAKRLEVSIRAKRAAECFRLICKNYDLDIDLSGVSRNLKVGPMLEAELLSIFMNSISNAIKSVIAAGKKKIAIRAHAMDSGMVKINILDSGLGVEPGNDDLFLPFLADPAGQLYSSLSEKLNPEDEHIVGSGSGLGLSIVRDIASAHDGLVRFVTAPAGGWKCNLEVILK